MLVGTADEMVKPLYRMRLETKGASETTERGSGLQDSDVMPGANEVKAGREPRKAPADDDDALARRVLIRAQLSRPPATARSGAMRARRGLMA